MATIIKINDATHFTPSSEPVGVLGGAQSEGNARIAPPSGDAESLTNTVSAGINLLKGGRSADLLGAVFPASVLGLETYDPHKTYAELMAGDLDLVYGKGPDRAASPYLGNGYVDSEVINGPGAKAAGHLTHVNAPELAKDVDIAGLDLVNSYVPNIAAPRAMSAEARTAFESKYPGARNSFPPVDGTGGLDLDASKDKANSSLSPKRTINRLGAWTNDTLTLGRWKSATSD